MYVCKPCMYMDTCQANSSQHTMGSWNHVLIIITYVVTYLVLLLCLTISGCTKISWWQNLFTDVSIVFCKLLATVNERHEGTVYLILHVYKVHIYTLPYYRGKFSDQIDLCIHKVIELSMACCAWLSKFTIKFLSPTMPGLKLGHWPRQQSGLSPNL